jgi:hypothetical protein
MTGQNLQFITKSPALSAFERMTDLRARGVRQQREEERFAEEQRRLLTDRAIDQDLAVVAKDALASVVDPSIAQQTAGVLAKRGSGKSAVDLIAKEAKTAEERQMKVLEQFGTRGNRALGEELAKKFKIEVPEAIRKNALFADGLANGGKIASDKGDPAWIASYATAFAKTGGNHEQALAEAGTPKTKKDSQLYTVDDTLVDGDGNVKFRGRGKADMPSSPIGRLKSDLTKGIITQEEFDQQAKLVGGAGRGATSAPKMSKTQNAKGEWVWMKTYRDGKDEVTEQPAPPPGNAADASRARSDAIATRKATDETRKHFTTTGRNPETVPDEDWDRIFEVNLKRARGEKAGVIAPPPEPEGPGVVDRVKGWFGAGEKAAAAPPKPSPDPGFKFPKDKPLIPTSQADIDAAPSGSYIMDPDSKRLFLKP